MRKPQGAAMTTTRTLHAAVRVIWTPRTPLAAVPIIVEREKLNCRTG